MGLRYLLRRETAFFALLAAVLLHNLLSHGHNQLQEPGSLPWLVVPAFVAVLLPLIWPASRAALWGILALSMPLYASHAFSSHSHVFELFLAALCFGTLLAQWRVGSRSVAGNPVVFTMGCYVVLMLGTVLLMPWRLLLEQALLWGYLDFTAYMHNARPHIPVAGLAGANRILLFFCAFLLLVRDQKAGDILRSMFWGLLAASVWMALLGIVEQLGWIRLDWYRVTKNANRLQSVLGNPGWYAEFACVVAPLVIAPLLQSRQLRISLVAIAFFILIGLSVGLTGSRTGWALVPMIVLASVLAYHLAGLRERGFGGQGARLYAAVGRGSLLLLGVSVLCVLLVFVLVAARGSAGQTGKEDYFSQRIQELTLKDVRLQIWHDAARLLSERPWYGFGINSYSPYFQAVDRIPGSPLEQTRRDPKNYDTPHNLFIMIMANGGLVALMLWLLLMVRVTSILLRDWAETGEHWSLAVFLALCAYHLYGVSQAMQYIPAIWFLCFVLLAWAAHRACDGVGQEAPVQQALGLANFAAGSLLVLALLVNLGDHQLRSVIDRYHLQHLDLDPQRHLYHGFYAREWWGRDQYRWSGRQARVEFEGSVRVSFTVVNTNPTAAEQPLEARLYLNGELVREMRFSGDYNMPIELDLEDDHARHEIRLEVSRTWIPRKLGRGQDRRRMGVAIGPLQFGAAT